MQVELPFTDKIDLGYNPDTGQLESIDRWPNDVPLRYEWNGMLLSKSLLLGGEVSGMVKRSYDDLLRLDGLVINGLYAIELGYDKDSLLVQAGEMVIDRALDHGLVTGTGLGRVATTRTYNDFGELASYTASLDGEVIFDQVYERDDLGRIVHKTEKVGATTASITYQYDQAGRLEEVFRDGERVSSYEYDTNSNRVAFTDRHGNVTTGTYDDQDRMLAYGDTTYTYTANGELATRTDAAGTTAYTYDVLGNLTDVYLPDGTHIHYIVDGRNRRVGKQVNGELESGFIYQDQLNPVAELDETGTVVSLFIYATRANVPDYIFSRKENGTDWNTYRVVSDHLGSPRLVVDTVTGAIVQELDYDEFGRVLNNNTNPTFQPFGFAGGLYEPQTGLVRFGARDYDLEVGRWTNKDPALFWGSAFNIYQYSISDPVNCVDPKGEQEKPGDMFLDYEISDQLGRSGSTPVVDIVLAAVDLLASGLLETMVFFDLLNDWSHSDKYKHCVVSCIGAEISPVGALLWGGSKECLDYYIGQQEAEDILANRRGINAAQRGKDCHYECYLLYGN